MTGRDAAPSLAGTLSTPLFWAVIGSIVVHTAFVAMPQSLPRRGSATTADQGPPLQATLVAPPTPPSEPEAEVAVADVSSPIQLAAQEAVAPPLPPAAVDQRPQSSSAAVVGVGAGDVRIDGALLVDRNRMGEVWTRQMTEFPIEVDYPARLDEKILARYPPAALAAGREDSVAVWIVVDANGVADEVVVLDGSLRHRPAGRGRRGRRHPLATRGVLRPEIRPDVPSTARQGQPRDSRSRRAANTATSSLPAYAGSG